MIATVALHAGQTTPPRLEPAFDTFAHCPGGLSRSPGGKKRIA